MEGAESFLWISQTAEKKKRAKIITLDLVQFAMHVREGIDYVRLCVRGMDIEFPFTAEKVLFIV